MDPDRLRRHRAGGGGVCGVCFGVGGVCLCVVTGMRMGVEEGHTLTTLLRTVEFRWDTRRLLKTPG